MLRVFTLLFTLLWLAMASAKTSVTKEEMVYYWVDENGQLHISDMKPPGAGAESKSVKVPQNIGTVKPKGSCDPSIGYKSEAKSWNKKRNHRRNERKIYSCR